MKIEKVQVDLKTQVKTHFIADVQSIPDATHTIYTLTYEGYRSEWMEVK